MKKKTLYVDAACNKHTGRKAWASVVDGETGEDLIGPNRALILSRLPELVIEDKVLPSRAAACIIVSFRDVESQNIVGGELLAMIAGLIIGTECGYEVLCSDSKIVADSWSLRPSDTVTDAEKIRYIALCIKLRKEFRGIIKRIPGDENLADLGWHRAKPLKAKCVAVECLC